MSKRTCPYCGREAIKDSDRCIFHDPEVWKRKPELVRHEIEEQINREDLDFEGYHFPEIDFSEIIRSQEFKKAVNFSNTHFHSRAKFADLQFEKANFEGARFSGSAYFAGANFSRYADFWGVRFSGSAYFAGANFSRHAEFSHTMFSGHANFRSAKFFEIANFEGAKFADEANFYRAMFSGFTSFRSVKFSDTANFTRAMFSGKVNFSGAKFSDYASFRGDTFPRDHTIPFDNVTFSGNVSLLEVPMDEVRLDFSYSVFRRELSVDEIKWSQRGYRLKIENTDLEGAIRNYHVLKKVFLNTGHYRVAGDLFYNEMACRRRLLSWQFHACLFSDVKRFCRMRPLKNIVDSSLVERLRNTRTVKDILKKMARQDMNGRNSEPRRNFWKQFIDWLWMQIFYFTCGFGERPWRVVILSFSTLSIFAFAYHLLISTSMKFMQKSATAIYLSFDCFVGLGVLQNDIIPLPYRWLTYVEAGLGLGLLSLFLVVFTRKMTRD